MQLETARFGVLEIDPSAVITLTQPILGFQEFRRFVLLPGPKGSAVKWLQSTESGDLAFIVIDPRSVVSGYSLKLEEHELTELAVHSVSELEIYTLVVVSPDQKHVRTNLKAPILLNMKHRLGKQTILERSDYPIQFVVNPAASDADGKAAETLHARSDA